MKKVVTVVMSVLMLVTLLGGCGNKEIDAYKEEAVAAIEQMGVDMTEMQTAMASFDGSDASFKTINEVLTKCAASCQAIVDLVPPEKAEDVHAKLSDSMNDVIAGLEIFQTAFESMDTIASTDEAKLTEAQSLMTSGSEKLIAVATEMDAL